MSAAAGGLPAGAPAGTVETPPTSINRYTRAVMVSVLVAVLVFGSLAFFAPSRTEDFFVWTIRFPPTAAFLGGAVGAWVAGIGAGLGWMAYDGDWRRVRLGAGLYVLILSLELVVVARFWNELAEGWRFGVYVAVLGVSLLAFLLAAWRHETRREPSPTRSGADLSVGRGRVRAS